MSQPSRFDRIAAMPWPEVASRFQVIAARQMQARASGCELSIAEHLDGLACAEAAARQLRDQALVYDALRAGATWEELADATATDADVMRAGFVRWLRDQRAAYLSRGPGHGLDAHQYGAGLRAASAADGRVPA